MDYIYNDMDYIFYVYFRKDEEEEERMYEKRLPAAERITGWGEGDSQTSLHVPYFVVLILKES